MTNSDNNVPVTKERGMTIADPLAREVTKLKFADLPPDVICQDGERPDQIRREAS